MATKMGRLHQDPRYRLAAALLLQQGEISIDEIEALPFVESQMVAEMLADELVSEFNAKRYQKHALGDIGRWEEVIQLNG